MKQGALIIGDDVIEKGYYEIIPIGNWTDLDNVLSPQASPPAVITAGSEAGFILHRSQINDFSFNSIFIFGTDIGSGSVAIDIRALNAPQWTPVKDYVAMELESAGSPRSVVILLPDYNRSEIGEVRVRFIPPYGSQGTVEIGHIMAGRAIQEIELADRGWSIQYIDSSEKMKSEGGQIFADDPNVSRELTISSSAMSSTTVFGEHEIIREIKEFPSGANLAGDTIKQGDWFVLDEGETGSFYFPKLFEVGKHYRVDYLNVIEKSGDGPVDNLTWGTTDFGLSDQRVGLVSATAEAEEKYLRFWRPARAFKSFVKILSVYEIKPLPASHGYKPHLASFQAMMARHGKSLPLLVVIRPNDPYMGKVTGVFGYLTNNVKLKHSAGTYFNTSMSVRETR